MSDKTYIEKIAKIRSNNNAYFEKHPDSPLTSEQRQNYKELSYFPADEKYRFEVQVELNPGPEEITIPTSTGDEQRYLRFASFEFKLAGQVNKLIVFKPPSANYFFVPFRDGTSGRESYGAGRYIEITPISGDKYEVDFNLAYNPYCAYNNNFSCPLTPAENVLTISIPAGEKKYHD